MYAKILVPIDGSDTANQALDEAISLARNLGSKIEILHVVVNSAQQADGSDNDPADAHEVAVGAGMLIIEEAQNRLAAAGLVARTWLIEGPIASIEVPITIVHAAVESQADIVVIGSHGKTGFRETPLGSVAEKVKDQCPLPVWIIHSSQKDTAATKA